MAKLKKNKALYRALIGTFIFLWCAVAFVSTLHAITFFQLTNTIGLAILLGTAYEIGQASVLFSILMTENKNRALAWGMLFLLTGLQVTANVYASYMFLETSGSENWVYWQESILLGVQVQDPHMYKIIISWISGALLPIVALGMTGLVVENIRIVRAEKEEELKTLAAEGNKADEKVDNLKKNSKEEEEEFNIESNNTKERIEERTEENVKEKEKPKEKVEEEINIQSNIEPVNKPRGWHFKNEFIDDEGKMFKKGKYSHTIPRKESKDPPLKKVWGRPKKRG